MYIKPTFRRDEYDGQQFARRQWFLILAQEDVPFLERKKGNQIRAFVRKVALHQSGHWMMGYAKIHNHVFTVSGAYGHDGLPLSIPTDVWEKGIPLPDELYDAWNHGGGWNSAGSERDAMTKWAKENFSSLAPEGATW